MQKVDHKRATQFQQFHFHCKTCPKKEYNELQIMAPESKYFLPTS